ncbi:hypothetical protein OG413_28835 [Streptomyces sp. NBC_01433]|uniref:hypothetical protein n=1 Tax=Streptomyces sp. NBC_01433 TaxID=2903864 RepID=UPI00225BAD91|nr:hypothetical protein [Streptomyces sp. NBC_01433]MCX4679255.1 hypothetical protein [Streptomyces sp. NBC_01433]
MPSPLGRPSRLRAQVARVRALDSANKIALGGLVLAGLAFAAPSLGSAYHHVFAQDSVVVEAKQLNSFCTSTWSTLPGNDDLLPLLPEADTREIVRWERERRIVQRQTLRVLIGLRGNTDKAAQLRDVTITVVSRDPLPTGVRPDVRTLGCGNGEEPPQAAGINLDLLAVGRPVSLSALRGKPGQRAAAKEALDWGKPVSLPHSLNSGEVYSLFLLGRTENYDVRWKATLTWWDGEKTKSVELDNDGRPFHVMADPGGTP